MPPFDVMMTNEPNEEPDNNMLHSARIISIKDEGINVEKILINSENSDDEILLSCDESDEENDNDERVPPPDDGYREALMRVRERNSSLSELLKANSSITITIQRDVVIVDGDGTRTSNGSNILESQFDVEPLMLKSTKEE